MFDGPLIIAIGELTIVDVILSKGNKFLMSVKIDAAFDSTAPTTNGPFQKRTYMSISLFR